MEEVYRFENGFKNENGNLVWDTEHLFKEVLKGIKKCGQIGRTPQTVAIDTWGVDYVLLDENKKELFPSYCYRDGRTEAVVGEVEKIIPQCELYLRTGIQKQSYNTIYQLYADKQSGKLDRAKYFLMMPAYLSFKLTGEIANEYTLATTTGLINAETKNWDSEILQKLGYKRELFGMLFKPTTKIGNFTKEIAEKVGFDATVIFAPSHDTASAVAATPMGEDDMYISSGTWSLIGIESEEAIINSAVCEANFANEGGIDYRFRFLKNYMGMWLLQNIRRNLDKKYTYDQMMNMAEECENYRYFDVNHQSLVAPDNMIKAIREYFKEPEMPLEEVLASVYHSLAKSYKDALYEIENITGKTIKEIHIVGGGCQDKYLNQLTAEYTGKMVAAGPVEATAVGNLISQLLYDKTCESLKTARKIVANSFGID